MLRLEHVRSELGKLMADAARKLSWNGITESPVGLAKEFVLYLVGSGEPVKVFKVELTWKGCALESSLLALCGDGLEKGEIQGRPVFGRLLQ